MKNIRPTRPVHPFGVFRFDDIRDFKSLETIETLRASTYDPTMMKETLPDCFCDAAARFADRPAIINPQNAAALRYDELNVQSDRIAAGLISRGIVPGDRVGLYGINSAAYVAIYLGIQKAGAIAVPINILLNPQEAAWILNDAGSKALFYFQPFAPAVEAVRETLSSIEHLFAVEEDLPELLREAKPAPDIPIDAESVAVIIYTSGTTGHPKGAMLTHRNLVSNARCATRALRLRGELDERFLTVLPMFHAFAAMAGIIIPLLNGCSLVPLPKFDPAQTAEAIARTGATIFLGVPSMYNLLLRLPERHTADLQGLHFCISGGAAMPQEIMQQFEKRFGVLIYEGDGPTECSPVTCVNPIGGKRKPQSVGPSIPGVEMKIMDEQGQEKPRGEIGEICVRGPNVMKGYWKRPDETRESFFGEWFRTGDLGTEDDDHYFYIVDRIKDMVIVNGMNVYPRIIEEVLYRHEAVREAAVVGRPDRLHGEVPVAFVAFKEGVSPTAQELRAFCREHLGQHEIPRTFTVLDELPKNAAGKIVKRELRKQGEVERGIQINPAAGTAPNE